MKNLTMMPNNKYTVQLLDVVYPQLTNPNNPDCIFLIMEYLDYDLRDIIDSNIDLTELNVQKIIYNILCAVNYLVSSNVLHRDLKPDNILVDKFCNIKICDFGFSRTLPESCIG